MTLKVCTRCVTDGADTEMTFDADGVSDNCRRFESAVVPQWHTVERGEKAFLARKALTIAWLGQPC